MPGPRLLILMAAWVAVLVMAADYLDLRRFENNRLDSPLPAANPWHPWSTYTSRSVARQAAANWRSDVDRAIERLRRAIDDYPLDGHRWLDLARIEASGHRQLTDPLRDDLIAGVATQPKDRSILWQAIQITLHAGEPSLTERYLRRWLETAPEDVPKALLIAGRWLDDPQQLIETVLPEGIEFTGQALGHARRQQDVALAGAVWRRVPPDIGLDSGLFLSYVDLLLEQGLVEQAVHMWAQRDPDYVPGEIVNGDFSRPLGRSRGLNWRINNLPDGIRVVLNRSEFHSAPSSLMLEFKGTGNLRLRGPWVFLPVQPGQRYELGGYWKASALTTRSLPFLGVESQQGRLLERVALPDRDFEWAAWRIVVTVPETSSLIRLRFNREPIDAFDRNIAGNLWLDDLSLRRLDAPPSAVPQ